MSTHKYTRNKLGDGRWAVNHPERLDEGAQIYLAHEVEAALPGLAFTLECTDETHATDPSNVIFVFEDELTGEQQTTLAATVAAHQANS